MSAQQPNTANEGEPMASMSKAALARHLTVPHGGVTSKSSLNELRQWQRSALVAEHERLCSLGPCPLADNTSFREAVVNK